MKILAVLSVITVGVFAQRSNGPIFFARYSAAPQPRLSPYARLVPYPAANDPASQQVPKTEYSLKPSATGASEPSPAPAPQPQLSHYARLVPYPAANEPSPQVPQTVYSLKPSAPGASAASPVEVGRNASDDSNREVTTEKQSVQVKSSAETSNKPEIEQHEKLQVAAEAEEPLEQGVYYLYHPNGVLQKVAYQTSNDAAAMAHTAQLRYQNVAPISEPIYTYNPQTYVLQQLHLN